jgi:hypothetical protein
MRARLFVLILGLLLATAAQAADPIARVVTQDGVAFVLRAAAQPQPLAVGADLFIDDEVRTGADGRLVVESPAGLKLVIGSASEVRIRRWLVDTRRSRIEVVLSMVTGVLRLLGEPTGTPRTVEVQTRAAVASVRSTEWLVEATGAGTAVFSIEGPVVVRSAAGGVTLAAGDGTDVQLGALPTPPVRWGQARIDRTLARVPF